MPEAAPSARAASPAVEKRAPGAPTAEQRELFLNPHTIILAMDQDETTIAEAWMLKHFGDPNDENVRPEVLERFVTQLDLRSLRKQSILIALVRGRTKRGGRTNQLGWYKSDTGERVTELVTTDKLVDEISVCTPLKCEDYWEDTGGRYGGRLRSPEFCSQLAQNTSSSIGSGARLLFLDTSARVKGEVPTEFALRWA